MSALTWHRGPPTHVGWWEASIDKAPGVWRWWNGGHWSCASFPAYGPIQAATCAAIRFMPVLPGMEVFWRMTWPENARVPRLDPAGGHWTFNDGIMPADMPDHVDYVSRGCTVFHHADKRRMVGLRWRLIGKGGDIIAWRPS